MSDYNNDNIHKNYNYVQQENERLLHFLFPPLTDIKSFSLLKYIFQAKY